MTCKMGKDSTTHHGNGQGGQHERVTEDVAHLQAASSRI
jgi:hypothetical protein